MTVTGTAITAVLGVTFGLVAWTIVRMASALRRAHEEPHGLDAPLRRDAKDGRSLHATLVDQMQEAVIAVDLDLKVVVWSSGAERLFGWRADEVMGRPVFSFTAPELSPGAIAAFRHRALAHRTLRETGARSRKDGSRIVVETTFVVLPGDGGEPTGILGVTRDVSELQQTYDALKASDTFHRALLAAMVEGVLVRAASGAVLAMNEAVRELLGLDEEQLAGLRPPPEGWGAFREDGSPLQALPPDEKTSGLGRGARIRLQLPGGRTRWVAASSTPLPGFGEHADATLSTFVDITEERRASEEALERAREKWIAKRINEIEPRC